MQCTGALLVTPRPEDTVQDGTATLAEFVVQSPILAVLIVRLHCLGVRVAVVLGNRQEHVGPREDSVQSLAADRASLVVGLDALAATNSVTDVRLLGLAVQTLFVLRRTILGSRPLGARLGLLGGVHLVILQMMTNIPAQKATVQMIPSISMAVICDPSDRDR